MEIDIKKILKQKAPGTARKIPSFLVDYLIRLVHQEELNEILRLYGDKDGVAFLKELVGYFDIHFRYHHIENIPSDRHVLFVCNHPLGGLDGICLSTFIGEHYGDQLHYLVNDLLLYIPNLRSIFVPINKHGAQSRENARLIEVAYASPDPVITFPAGLCSRRQRGKIEDLEWKKSFIQKAVEYKRDVIPLYFDGCNSNRFYTIANLRKALGIRMNFEMLLLPDEMFRSKHKTFDIYVGKPIPWDTFLSTKRKPAEWAEWVKKTVYHLKHS